MQSHKLNRDETHTVNPHPGDYFCFWNSPIHGLERQNLNLRRQAGGDIVTIYGLTHQQLADLYLEIATILGKSPEATLYHLKEVHEAIGKLIGESGIQRPLPS